MRNYELMVVIDPSSDAEKIDRTVAKIQETITEKGGKIISVDNWGRRRLAYEIERRQYGFYVLFTFELDPKEVKDLDRLLRLNQMVLRHLAVVLDPKIMEVAVKRPPAEVDAEEVVVPVQLDEELDEVEIEPELVQPEEEPAAPEEPAPEKKEAEPEKTKE
jgi:small subunit ribosomal protein S6